MDAITAQLLIECCKEKGVDLTGKLKTDVDHVLSIISNDVLASGVKQKIMSMESMATARLAAVESRIKIKEGQCQEAINELRDIQQIENRASSLRDNLNVIMQMAQTLQANTNRLATWTKNSELVDARKMYAGMLQDAKEIIGNDEAFAAAIPSIYTAASYSIWKVSPEQKGSNYRL